MSPTSGAVVSTLQVTPARRIGRVGCWAEMGVARAARTSRRAVAPSMPNAVRLRNDDLLRALLAVYAGSGALTSPRRGGKALSRGRSCRYFRRGLHLVARCHP